MYKVPSDWHVRLAPLSESSARALGLRGDYPSAQATAPASKLAVGSEGHPVKQASPAKASRKAWRIARLATTGERRLVSPTGKVCKPLAQDSIVDTSRCGVLSPDTSVPCGTYYKPYKVARYSSRTQTSSWRKPATLAGLPLQTVYYGRHGRMMADGSIGIDKPVIVSENASIKATLGVDTAKGIAPLGRTGRKATGACGASTSSDAFFQGL